MAGTTYTQLLQSGPPSMTEHRHSLSHHPSSIRPSLTLTPKLTPIPSDTEPMMMDPFGNAQATAMPPPLSISIGTVDVVTPMGFHSATDAPSSSGNRSQDELDALFTWSDLKRKRPQNQTQKQAQNQTQPNWYPSNPMAEHFGSLPQGTNDPMSLFNGFPEPFQQSTIPPQNTNKSRHVRRASMPHTRLGNQLGSMPTTSTGLSMDLSQMDLGFLQGPEEQFQQHMAQQRQLKKEHFFQNHQMNMDVPPLGYNSPVLQSPAGGPQQQMPSPIRLNVSKFALGDSAATAAARALEEANRKSYKCGRCGQPKVGHVCTMPDLRNNWAQAELEVTSGLRPASRSVNCLIVSVKGPWIPLHEDNM